VPRDRDADVTSLSRVVWKLGSRSIVNPRRRHRQLGRRRRAAVGVSAERVDQLGHLLVALDAVKDRSALSVPMASSAARSVASPRSVRTSPLRRTRYGGSSNLIEQLSGRGRHSPVLARGDPAYAAAVVVDASEAEGVAPFVLGEPVVALAEGVGVAGGDGGFDGWPRGLDGRARRAPQDLLLAAAWV
jgi:hypothetical protein